MRWFRAIPFILLAGNAYAAGGYILGAGLEGDSADGLAASVMGDVEVGDKTWVSAAFVRSEVDVGIRSPDAWYGDLGIDHWFDPAGVRFGVSYWGDNDTLDSNDWRASLYWRNERFSIAGDYEFRDFTVDIPATDFFPARTVSFDASGVGITTRIDVSDNVSIGVYGMDYDYGVNLRLDRNRGLLELLAFSRLSLINSLVDYQAHATLGLDVGDRRWELDIGTWKGEVDGGTTRSATVSLLNPLGNNADLELAIGVDDSEIYGNVTFFSVFLFFYGGR